MQDYLTLMRLKRTAALATALILGMAVLILSLFVETPATAETAAVVDPMSQTDEVPVSSTAPDEWR